MGNLASDIDNTAFAGAVPDTSGLGVRFYKDVRKNEYRSGKEGRPIFEDVTMVHIVLPGGLHDIKEAVQERHKMRFPQQWAAFQNAHDGSDPMMIGTPLDQWPMIGRSAAEELKALRFYTVESIANASDATLQRMGMAGGMAGPALRDRAIRYLEVAKDNAAVDRQAEEIAKLRAEQEEKDRLHGEQMQAMQTQLAALTAAFQAKPAAKPRGRPKKIVQEE